MKRPNDWRTVPPEDDVLATSIYQLTLAIMYLADVMEKSDANG